MKPLQPLLYFLIVSAAICVLFAVSVPLFLQIVNFDTATERWWYAALFLLPYLVLAIASLLSNNIRHLILKNRVKYIPRENVVYQHGEIPEPVHALIKREYERASAIAFMSQPKGGSHPGWGALGGPYEKVPFRPTILGAVRDLDSVARALLPSLPPLKPQTHLLSHFRSLLIFVPVGPKSDALKVLDSIYSLAKYTEGSRELTEEEFAAGIEAARLLRDVFQRELDVLERESIRSGMSGMRSDLREGMEESEQHRPSSSHVQVMGYAEDGSFSGASFDIAPS